MKPRTSFSFDKDFLVRLKEEATLLQLSTTQFIIFLMHNYVEKANLNVVLMHTIDYQEELEKPDTFTCELPGEEYEFFLDLRKVYKKSVSLLIVEAFFVFQQGKSMGLTLRKNMIHNYVLFMAPGGQRQVFLGIGWEFLYPYNPFFLDRLSPQLVT